jgi:hypothetical protein
MPCFEGTAMSDPLEALNRFDTVLAQTASKIASRLQPGLTRAEIEAQVATFSWIFPQDAFDLYQQHNGLSGKPGKLNLAEKLIRLKGKWHGELSGRESEVHLKLGDSLIAKGEATPTETRRERLIVAKFLPLDYALAGHRHLKLGRCLVDLLPFAILTDGKETSYCMMRLDPDAPIIYCANGTNLPPMKVTASFLSTQPQFSQLSEFITFLTAVFQQGVLPIEADREELIDCKLDLMQFKQLYQQRNR